MHTAKRISAVSYTLEEISAIILEHNLLVDPLMLYRLTPQRLYQVLRYDSIRPIFDATMLRHFDLHAIRGMVNQRPDELYLLDVFSADTTPSGSVITLGRTLPSLKVILPPHFLRIIRDYCIHDIQPDYTPSSRGVFNVYRIDNIGCGLRD